MDREENKVTGDIRENRTAETGMNNEKCGRATVRMCIAAAFLCLLAGFLLLTGCGKDAPGNGSGQSSGHEPASSPEAHPNAGETEVRPGVFETAASYPEAAGEKMDPQEFLESDEHWEWLADYRMKTDVSTQYKEAMYGYCRGMMEKILLSGDDGANTVCSPLNTYFAFALLAEVSGGNTRQQILDMLQVPDMETLRTQTAALWDSSCVDTPNLKSLPANSLWLRDSTGYNEETLRLLAEQYCASAFRGDPGSEEMSEALRRWTDEHTGGLLGDYIKDMKLDASTVLAIVSAIYYKAAWTDVFYPQGNTQETFHGTNGDTEVEMMHRSDSMAVCTTDTYTAVGLSLFDSGSMVFYLPQEGTDVNDLVKDPEILQAAECDRSEKWSFPQVNLSIPKFRVSGKTDLIDILKELGVTDALDPSVSDFTPLTEEEDELFISTAEHAAMIEVDENGVTGAAYTELALADGAALVEDVIDFTVDRPFLFVVTGADGSVLFSGIVRNIG